MLEQYTLSPRSVCEVGCGAGEVLRQLWLRLRSQARFVGYDISPDAHALAAQRAEPGLEFRLADACTDAEEFDLMLLLDVIEHVPDCVNFLAALRPKATHTIMHIPLELTVQAALRPGRLLRSRAASGHLHFFNEELARATVRDAGYNIIRAELTSGGIDRPPQSRLARLARPPRRAMGEINASLAARLLGGFSLLLLTQPAV
jgi:SAM-dependent methyltransferase